LSIEDNYSVLKGKEVGKMSNRVGKIICCSCRVS
jgi:hypothetical protein